MSFFSVRWKGAVTNVDGAERYFNLNVTNAVLLQCIQRHLGLHENDTIDLVKDTGEVLEVYTKPKEYARKYIEPRTLCIINRVQQTDKEISYIPLFETETDKSKVAAGKRKRILTIDAHSPKQSTMKLKKPEGSRHTMQRFEEIE